MNRKHPIICEMCLKQLGEISQKRITDLGRLYFKLMNLHRGECTQWNQQAALIIGLTRNLGIVDVPGMGT